MKRKNINKLKVLVSFFIIISIIFINSFSLIASAYGATLDFEEQNPIPVYIRNASNGKYITAPNETFYDGIEVELSEGKENHLQKWYVYNHGDGIYSYHSARDVHYVLAIGNDINGAKIVLKYITNVNNITEDALFWSFNYIPMQVNFLYNMKSMNNGNTRVITCEYGSNTLKCSDIKSGIDNSIVQCWVFESIDRSTPLMSWDLVDIGGHCDWDCSSQYSSMVRKAANAWNDYIGAEVFRPDAWNVVQDVKIRDMDTDPTRKGSLARTYSNDIFALGEDAKYASSIYFYKDTMGDLQSDLQRQKVVMHELGHALGLGHNRTIDDAVSERLGNTMQQGELPYGTVISLDDKAAVEKAYEGF